MNEKAKKIATIGWFATATRPGDRTLEQQMVGLDKVVAEVAGKTVLDAGCAEGLISMEMAKAGATKCVGLEVIAGHVAIGKALVGDLPVELKVVNLNEFDLSTLDPADVVLMLACLHKLKDPSTVCAGLAALARDLVVIRLPPYGLTIVDDRSGNVPHDIAAVMEAAGFTLESEERGPFDEYLAYFRRKGQPQFVKSPEHDAEGFEGWANRGNNTVHLAPAGTDPNGPVDAQPAEAVDAAVVEQAAISDETKEAAGATEAVESATEAPKTETVESVSETEAKPDETPTRRRRAAKAEE